MKYMKIKTEKQASDKLHSNPTGQDLFWANNKTAKLKANTIQKHISRRT